VHGLAVLLDRKAEPGKRQDAVAEIAGGSAALLGAEIGSAAIGIGLSSAIAITWAEFKWMMTTYGEARYGLNRFELNEFFVELDQAGRSMFGHADRLAKAEALRGVESDPEKAHAFAQLEQDECEMMGAVIDDILGAADRTARDNMPVVAEVFAPLQAHRGARTPQQVRAGALVAADRIRWTFQHADELTSATVYGKHVADIEREEAKRAEKTRERTADASADRRPH